MSVSIVHDDPFVDQCGYCDNGIQGDQYCRYCGGDGITVLDFSALATLAHNIAWGAALCASFEMGRDAGPGPHIPFKTSWWRPGCGKPWSWPHLTRDDRPEGDDEP